MPEPSKDQSEYHEEMRRWMAKQTFWHRMKHGRHGGGRANMFSFLMKAFVVVLVLGAVAGVAYFKMLSKQVSSAQFANQLKFQVAEQLDARAVEGSSISWSSGVARVREFSIVGGRSNFFSTLEVDRFNFPLEYMDVIKGELNINNIEVDGVDLKLRSGAFTDREWEELLRDDDIGKQKAGGGWLSPSVDLNGIRNIDIRNFDAAWGAKSWMAGSLTECDLEVTSKDGTWNVLIESGKFSQNWIKGAEIQKIMLEIDSSAIRVIEAKLIMPSGSLVDITGVISLHDDPEFDLSVDIENFHFTDYIAEEKAMIVAGDLEADIKITGSVNRNEGLITRGRLTAEPKDGAADSDAIRDQPWLIKFGRNFEAELPVFRAFGDTLGADGVRFFTSERTVVDFETSQGNLNVTSMKFNDPMVGQLDGSFTYDGRAEAVTDGNLTLSLKEDVFESNRELREVRSSLFTEGANGTSQFSIELRGSIDVLTEMAAQRVKKAAEEIDG